MDRGKKIRIKQDDVQVTLVLGMGKEIVIDSSVGEVCVSEEQVKLLEEQLWIWGKYLEVLDIVEENVQGGVEVVEGVGDSGSDKLIRKGLKKKKG